MPPVITLLALGAIFFSVISLSLATPLHRRINPRFPYGDVKVRGVNIGSFNYLAILSLSRPGSSLRRSGGWLVLEVLLSKITIIYNGTIVTSAVASIALDYPLPLREYWQ